MHEIVFQGRVGGVWVLLGRELCFIDSDQFLSFAGLLAETVIGDAIKPGGKLRFSSKAADVFVSAQESLLSEVIGQGQITSRELSEQAADRGLVIADQFRKGVVIIVNQDPRDKIGIIKRHLTSLHLGGRLFFMNVQSPNEQVAQADQERDDAEAPDAAFPVVDGAEEDDQARADHEKGDPAAQIGTLADNGWRI